MMKAWTIAEEMEMMYDEMVTSPRWKPRKWKKKPRTACSVNKWNGWQIQRTAGLKFTPISIKMCMVFALAGEGDTFCV